MQHMSCFHFAVLNVEPCPGERIAISSFNFEDEAGIFLI